MIFHAVYRVAGPYALETSDFTARQDLGGWNREPNDAQESQSDSRPSQH